MTARRWIVLSAAFAALLTTVVGAQAAARAKTLKIAMVTDSSGLNDRSFNHLAYVGLQRAQKLLGVQVRVAESRAPSDYIPNLATFARQGYDLVVGVGYTEIAAMGAVAKRFPKTKFAIVDVANQDLPGKPKNVLGLLFHEEQVGYLAGYLAGLEAKRLPGKDVVSSVAGEKQPPVDRYIAGFQAGAKKADPNIKTLNGYSQDFVKQDLCKEEALNQIAEGSQVVFQVAGQCGLGALDAAKEKGVQGIGVDADQGYLGPQVITSALKKVDVAVFDTVKQAQDGSFKGGEDTVFDVKSGGVGLGKISAKGSKYESDVKKVQQQIASGEITDIPDTVK
jgi:basic membrane protein A